MAAGQREDEAKGEIVIKFSLPEVSDSGAFSGFWYHSPATPRLIG